MGLTVGLAILGRAIGGAMSTRRGRCRLMEIILVLLIVAGFESQLSSVLVRLLDHSSWRRPEAD